MWCVDTNTEDGPCEVWIRRAASARQGDRAVQSLRTGACIASKGGTATKDAAVATPREAPKQQARIPLDRGDEEKEDGDMDTGMTKDEGEGRQNRSAPNAKRGKVVTKVRDIPQDDEKAECDSDGNCLCNAIGQSIAHALKKAKSPSAAQVRAEINVWLRRHESEAAAFWDGHNASGTEVKREEYCDPRHRR